MKRRHCTAILLILSILAVVPAYTNSSAQEWYRPTGPSPTPPEPVRPTAPEREPTPQREQPTPQQQSPQQWVPSEQQQGPRPQQQPARDQLAIAKQAFLAAACMYDLNPSAACLSENALSGGARLAKIFAVHGLKSVMRSAFVVYLPNFYTVTNAEIFLTTLEKAAVNTIAEQTVKDLNRMRGLRWQTEDEKRRALLIIEEDERTVAKWNREALEEAKRAKNWSPYWLDNKNAGYIFHPGPAYQQLTNITSLGWKERK